MFKCKSSGSTPLHIVASTGNIKTLMVLLEAMQCHNIDTLDLVSHIGRCNLTITSEVTRRNCILLFTH